MLYLMFFVSVSICLSKDSTNITWGGCLTLNPSRFDGKLTQKSDTWALGVTWLTRPTDRGDGGWGYGGPTVLQNRWVFCVFCWGVLYTKNVRCWEM